MRGLDCRVVFTRRCHFSRPGPARTWWGDRGAMLDTCDVEVRAVESIQMLEQVFRWGAVVIVLAVVVP
jgi:hypothetical protein